MFTGIIKDVGTVGGISRQRGGLRLKVRHSMPEAFVGLAVDESVSINGACQTVVGCTPDSFEVDSVEETLAKTTLGSLREGALVNLERALRPMDRMGGHFVLGHVDTSAPVSAIRELGSSREITVSFPAAFAPVLVSAGSIAIDGVSLTVARLEDNSFTVAVIPYTVAHTTIAALKTGSMVNLEFDILGKYVARRFDAPAASSVPASSMDEAWLRQQGF
ncbi:riboflavin synthase [Chlorobium phaeovibrioides]|uniref:Riboflavin synthase n=2 Tax=Chlorobium phaeovibrioides TaxID=1094 RepID=A0A3S0NYN3_CHLPH|nr:riboflavin synthase [Chlorobium phaeovibrioides]QEQ56823.1 riboflavin synthase [Chlorobium phaeovibrioides]RTY36330.1 riboflavin synthase [Chlorobium phaeovibrioides]RTY37288.1 riboflavin synthase [Chlorobium phaeovibrioides]HCD37071.1 riboflavin synthase [Chlorobium sp.]